ncbi:MAG: Nif3-like dinuclear metal center hexameric protein [Armatimonadetes bacterium]|nr:Nif3-like dinuclear metal center hexameric protein [Armatimonadota bacterium]
MPRSPEIVAFLDEYLRTREVPDSYCPNGLQVEGEARVSRVGFCVDACMQTFEQLADCQLVVVHHGLFWPSVSRVVGPVREQLRFLLQRGMGLYCSHLPLDKHREVGNNARLLKLLDLEPEEEFGPVGWTGSFGTPVSRDAILDRLAPPLGNSVRLLPFGPETVGKIAVSSGSGSIGMVAEAVRLGAGMFLTGEAGHPIYHAARELGMNVLLGGHYATETWGVRALMPVLEERFGVETRFVDVPTGF